MEPVKHSNLSIKQWAEQERPREKLLEKGRHALSDAELIAILLGSGTRNESAVELARKVLHTSENNLFKLGKLSVQELQKIKGIGQAKAITIVSALELGRRRTETDPTALVKIKCSNDIYTYVKPFLSDLYHEEFWVIYLNRANCIIKKEKISSGGIAGTVVDQRMIYKTALNELASSIILCHNHPSGNTSPSEQDKSITKKITEACRLLDIQLLDHIIFTDKGFYSFADENILN